MTHEVRFDIPTRDLGKSDIHFTVKINGSTFGKLEVSKGALVWCPANNKYGYKMTWTDLDKEMQKSSNRVKRKKTK